MVGPDGIFHGAMVEFRAPFWELLGQHRYGVYAITHPEGSGVLLPAGQGDRWLFAVEWDQRRRDRSLTAGREVLRRHIMAASGRPDIDVRIERVLLVLDRGAGGRAVQRGRRASWSVTPPTGSPRAVAPG